MYVTIIDNVGSPERAELTFYLQDYDSVYRCGDFSDSESDIEEHNRCFNFDTVNLFKRKHPDDDALDTDGKVCGSDVVPSKMFKNWFRKNPPSAADVNKSRNAEDSDPTYGFAKHLENRTYFRNNNVDTSIQMDCLAVDKYQDVLYPLRTSTGSNDSSASPGNGNGNGGAIEYTMSPISIIPPKANANIFIPATASRKRVQFDERSNKVNVFRRQPQYQHNPQHTKGYLFTAQHVDGKMSLRQRITNFFTNLF